MPDLDAEFVVTPTVLDSQARAAAISRAHDRDIVLPTFAQLAGKEALNERILGRIGDVDPDAPHADNLWRVHWYNSSDRRGRTNVPAYIVLPPELTGVRAPIVVLLGSRFPMIQAHKVLPAYAGLVTQLTTGRFNPKRHRAVWPSTGNYCRGGIAISRILGCDGIAVLPEGMSRERYEWLERWVADPSNIVRTVGTESNVKEIYDKCHELAGSDENIVLNQFSAFSNYLSHHACTGAACSRVFEDFRRTAETTRLAAFVSATGSAGTIAAGDHLKDVYGSRIAAVEALECPTMLENGYGEHNIQGIGDKHVPLIHNVMNTDFVIAVSDRVCDRLNVLFNSRSGKAYLNARAEIEPDTIASFAEIGLSGLANIVAAVKLARYMDYGAADVILTIATDSARLYRTEMEEAESRLFGNGFSGADARHVLSACMQEISDEHVLELGQRERRRIFNLGYYTWVEQQNVAVEDFDARRNQSFWQEIVATLPQWDQLITEFNAEVGFG